jgi:L-methionine (R)-S-oxide reductase
MDVPCGAERPRSAWRPAHALRPCLLYAVAVNEASRTEAHWQGGDLPTGLSSTERYAFLAEQATALFEGERDFIANCANLSALLFNSLEDVNWCGFYLTRHHDLVLGPFQGQVACVRIPVGRGVCGNSAEQRRTVVVPDVHTFPGHIACDPLSRSEVVVPLIASERLVGVLDIDSPSLGRFDDVDATGLERLTAILLASSDLPQGY